MDEELCEKCGEKATCFIYTDEGITCLCIEHYRTPYKKGDANERSL